MEIEIGRLKPRDIERVKEKCMLADGGGLYLKVGEGGRSKLWVFRYALKRVIDGKTVYRDRNMSLGPLHDVTFEEAREKRRECRRLLRDGIDPLEDRKAKKAARQIDAGKVKTLRELLPGFFKRFEAKWSLKYYKQAQRYFAVYILPKIGDLPVGLIDVQVVSDLLQPIQKRREVKKGNLAGQPSGAGRNIGGGPKTAEGVRIFLKQVFDYAEALSPGYRSGANPAEADGPLGMLLPKKHELCEVEHHPALPINQVGAFMTELRNHKGNLRWRGQRAVAGLILEFIVLCPVRRHQVPGMRWDEINWDMKIWTCPKKRTKTGKRQSGKDHVLPLSDACIAVLKAMEARGNLGEYVFGGDKSPNSGNVSNFLRRLPTKWVDKDGRRISLHGFRTTFQSWAIERCPLDNAKELSELVLGHVVRGNDMTRIYGRLADHSNPLRLMLEQWAQFCNRTEPLPNVLPFAASK